VLRNALFGDDGDVRRDDEEPADRKDLGSLGSGLAVAREVLHVGQAQFRARWSGPSRSAYRYTITPV
jgi:hypothetical protein